MPELTNAQVKEFNRIGRIRLRDELRGINRPPHFPHLTHTILSVITCGWWLPIYYLNYRKSERRKFLVNRFEQDMAQARMVG